MHEGIFCLLPQASCISKLQEFLLRHRKNYINSAGYCYLNPPCVKVLRLHEITIANHVPWMEQYNGLHAMTLTCWISTTILQLFLRKHK